ncbi:hypothetical protein H632_c1162p1 [Helicosporidium sp. ATCC 50920]|nr:hypothetical protein H632_c1162p1 [Helicosporidium sp. ATCC 50920]|eukprot:KDD74644.1 hypothetical protein H632_c1162p1 [Helicosporidium sp. ATCC 50920]
MLCCYALSRLPVRQGTLDQIHAAMHDALCGMVVLPWPDQIQKYLNTSSLDGRGIQKLQCADGQILYQFHEDCIPSVLRPGWMHFRRDVERLSPRPSRSSR